MNSDYIIKKDVNDKHIDLAFRTPFTNQVLEQFTANLNKGEARYSHFTNDSIINSRVPNTISNKPSMSSYVAGRKLAFQSLVE